MYAKHKDAKNGGPIGIIIQKEDVPASAKPVAVSGLAAALAAKRVSSESGGTCAMFLYSHLNGKNLNVILKS